LNVLVIAFALISNMLSTCKRTNSCKMVDYKIESEMCRYIDYEVFNILKLTISFTIKHISFIKTYR